jgi:hypothetical protein
MLQFASKLFVESRYPSLAFHKLLHPGTAPILCLLGDICSPYSKKGTQFLQWCSQNWDQVLWVPGYYEIHYMHGAQNTQPTTMEERVSALTTATKPYSNIKMMTNATWSHPTIKNTIFLGTPLYTRFMKVGDKYIGMNSPMVERNIRWLESHISEAEDMDENAIVLSHSPPSQHILMSDDVDAKNPTLDLSHLMAKKPVRLWMMGDTIHCYRSVQNWRRGKRSFDYPCVLVSNTLQNVLASGTSYMPNANILL